MLFLNTFKRRKVNLSMSKEMPFITFIITAFNEEKNIQNKIKNTIDIDYPTEKFEILIASDGSTDGTNEIVRSFSDKNVRLIEVVDRKGKENAQLHAIKEASGSIFVFSDVTTRVDRDVLINLAETFQDASIGAVSSVDKFIEEDGTIAGEGAYVRYEMWLRKIESEVNSLVGLSGSLFAARKEICEDWAISIPSDFNTALNCIRSGRFAISAPNVIGYYPNLKDEKKEYHRKVRTVIRGIAALAEKKEVLNPLKYGFFSFQIFSHKLMRWAVPWFALLLIISNTLLWNVNLFFNIILIMQIIFYGMALTGFVSDSARRKVYFKIPYFFVQVNLAIADSCLKYLAGKRVTMWTPSKR